MRKVHLLIAKRRSISILFASIDVSKISLITGEMVENISINWPVDSAIKLLFPSQVEFMLYLSFSEG